MLSPSLVSGFRRKLILYATEAKNRVSWCPTFMGNVMAWGALNFPITHLHRGSVSVSNFGGMLLAGPGGKLNIHTHSALNTQQ